MLGNIVAIGAGLSFSGVFFINSLPKASSKDCSMIAFFLSFLISIPFLGEVGKMNGTAVAALVVLGVFQVGAAYVCLCIGLKTTPPVTASLISGIEPVLNPILVALFYGEQVGGFAMVGAAVVIVGVVGYNVLKGRQNIETASEP